jgi:hypothetical protein
VRQPDFRDEERGRLSKGFSQRLGTARRFVNRREVGQGFAVQAAGIRIPVGNQDMGDFTD